MGFTHYWETKPTVSKKKWGNFTEALKILLKDVDIVQKEYDTREKPVINTKEVRFNGIGEDGHETFYIKRIDKPATWASDKSVVFGFTKTARKPYDKYVTASLLLAQMYLQDEIKISSDGDVEDWQEGRELVNSTVGKVCNFKIEVKENPEAEYPTSISTALISWAILDEVVNA